MDRERTGPRKLPCGRPWQVIDEIDLAPLLADHAAVRLMCRTLEAMADRLAGRPPLDERRAMAASVLDCIRHHVSVTRPILDRMATAASVAFGRGIVSRLLQAQIADEAHAHDVAEALSAERLDAAAAERLGYMLRCLFDGCRRGLDGQLLALLSLNGGHLTRAARLALEHAAQRQGDTCWSREG